jgi:phosphatidate cytidylyltransferase
LQIRLLTAGVLAPIVVCGIVFLSPDQVAALLGIFLVVGAWEWSGLLGWKRKAGRVLYTGTLVLCAVIVWRWNEHVAVFPHLHFLAIIWWILALVLVIAAQRQRLGKFVASAGNGVSGLLVLLPAWSAIVWLLNNDRAMLLSLFALIWVADAAAYFVGRKYGRVRLASNVSPGKSWEGVAGGVGFGVVCAIAISRSVLLSDNAGWAFVIVAMVTIFASIIGDLFESMLKRNIGAKDSGQILPGHGGVLDRIDGLVAAAPVFAVGLHQWVYKL